jgi:hypothetical protein
MMVGSVCLRSPRLLPGVGAMFHPRGDKQKVDYVDHVRCMIRDPTQIKHGKRVAC